MRSFVFAILLMGQFWHQMATAQSKLAIPANAVVYKVGIDTSNDFVTIQAATQFITSANVTQPLVFLLQDSTYPNDSFPIVFGLPQHISTQGSITFQPANGVHVRFENPIWRNQSMFVFHTTVNTKLYGRSPDSTGTITIIDHSPASKPIINLTVSQQYSNVGTEICYLDIEASFRGNRLVAIQGTSEWVNRRIINVEVAYNRIRGARTGILIRSISQHWNLSPFIHHNYIGGVHSNFAFMANGIMISRAVNALVEDNVVAFIESDTVLSGIVITGASNTTFVSRNRVNDLRSLTAWNGIRGIAVEHSSFATLVANQITGFSAASNVNLFVPFAGIYLQGGSSNLFHNTVSIADSAIGSFGVIAPVYLFSVSAAFEVKNNIFEIRRFNTGANLETYIFYSEYLANVANTTSRWDNNVYLYPLGPQSGLARRFGPLTYFTFADWRDEVQRRGNLSEQYSIANTNGQLKLVWTSSSQLVPDSNLAININGMASVLPSLSADQNSDLLGRIRPAFGSSSADPGALEFSALASRDTELPRLDSFYSSLNELNYQALNRRIAVMVSDSLSGVSKVEIRLHCNETDTVYQLFRDLSSGLPNHWEVQIPFDSERTCWSVLYVSDSAGNRSVFNKIHAWRDEYLKVDIGPDIVITEQDSVRLLPGSNGFYTIGFTEVFLHRFPGGVSVVYPPYLPSDLFNGVEISNFGNDTVDISGVRVQLSYRFANLKEFVFPRGTVLTPGAVVIVGNGSGSASPTNGFYLFDSVPNGFVRYDEGIEFAMYDPLGKMMDYLPLNFQYPHFNNLGQPGHWFGTGISTGTEAGVSLTSLDLNRVEVWQRYSTFTASPGQYHLPFFSQDSIQWQWDGPYISQRPMLQGPPLAAGTYTPVLQLQSGSTTVRDSLTLRVSGRGVNDFIKPELRNPQVSDKFYQSCASSGRFITIEGLDPGNGSGIDTVWFVLRNTDSLPLLYVASLDSGTAYQGRYKVQLPSLNRNEVYTSRIFARDSSGNFSDTIEFISFSGRMNEFEGLGNDTIVEFNQVFSKRMRVNTASREALQFTEFVSNFGIIGSQAVGTLPPGLGALGANTNVVKFSNLGHDSIQTAGLIFTVHTLSTNTSFKLPGVLLAPSQDLYLVFGGSIPTSSIHRVFKIGTSPFFQNGQSVAISLRDSLDGTFLSALALNGFQFAAGHQVPIGVWSGMATTLATSAGVYRTNLAGQATSWGTTNAQNSTRLGLVTPIEYRMQFQWLIDGLPYATTDSINWSADRSVWLSVYDSSWACGIADSIRITVRGGNNETDLAIDSIVSLRPAAIANLVTPIIRLINHGPESISRIGLAVSWNGVVIGSDRIDSTIDAGDTLLFELSQPIDIADTSMGTLLCIQHLWTKDLISNNNEACSSIELTNTSTRPQNQLDRIGLYPNPANGYIRVVLPEAIQEQVRWSCIDALGRQVALITIQDLGAGTWQLNTEHLQPGLYQIMGLTSELSWNAKFVVKR